MHLASEGCSEPEVYKFVGANCRCSAISEGESETEIGLYKVFY